MMYWDDWLHGNQHHHNESTNLIKMFVCFAQDFGALLNKQKGNRFYFSNAMTEKIFFLWNQCINTLIPFYR